jgi:hypothetical protein
MLCAGFLNHDAIGFLCFFHHTRRKGRKESKEKSKKT